MTPLPRSRRVAGATGLWLLAWGAGCFGNETTPFPEGLEPLEESTAEPPAGTADQPFPEEIRLVSGSTSGYVWVHARGYVRAPLREVYRAMHTPEVCVDRRAVDRWRIIHDVEPEYDYSFQIHNEVDDIITVEFDVNWRFGVVEGTESEPRLTAATFQKVFGTTFISLMRGSVVARSVPGEEAVTELEMVEHLQAASGGVEAISAYVRDYFADLVAVSHGRPLPTF